MGNLGGVGFVAYMRCRVGCFSRVRMEGLEEFRVWGVRVMGFQRLEVKDFGGVRISGFRGFCK